MISEKNTKRKVRDGEPPRHHAAVQVPKWVPDDLKGEYRDFAIEEGEEVAASRVRRLKAEALR